MTGGPLDPQAALELLNAARRGEAAAEREVAPLVYDELRRLADRHMGGERVDHTLQATALVHEAWLRLMQAREDWESRAAFYGLAARVMRNVLVDYARARGSQRRGGGAQRQSFEFLLEGLSSEPLDGQRLLDLDESLEVLRRADGRKADIVDLCFFGGLSHAEIGRVLELSPSSIEKDLRAAKAWLRDRMDR